MCSRCCMRPDQSLPSSIKAPKFAMSASFFGREHTNLSVLQVIGSSVSSLLGPIKGVKCLFDEESSEGVLVTSTNELLQGLDIEHPVGQLAREFCLSQHKRHGSGCTTLVTLAGLWAANVQSLLNQDVPVQDIIHIGDEFLQECEDIAEQSTVSIRSLCKPTRAIVAKGKERDGVPGNSSASLQVANAGKGTESLSLNQNSNNNCALPSQAAFKSTTHSESSGDAHWKYTVTSNFESTVSFVEQKHASPVPIASSAILNTSSAILEDDDDVSWFFENDFQYSDKAEDTNSSDGGYLASKLQEFSLHEHKQKKTSPKKLMEEQDVDDVEWFFEDKEIDRMCSVSHSGLRWHSDDIERTITSEAGEEKETDVSLKVTGLKETVEEDMEEARESNYQLLHGPQSLPSHQDREKSEQTICRKGVYSVLEQRQDITKGDVFPRTFPIKSADHLESLLESAIEQKPSKLLKGSHRILSRHLVANAQDIDTLHATSETLKNKGKLAVTSIDHRQHHFKDVKASVIPTLTQRQRSSDSVLTQCDTQSFEMLIHNVEVNGILVEELTVKAEESQTIAAIGNSLSHGAVAEMKLAIQACQMQLNASQEHYRSAFSPDLVHIQTVTGPSSSSSCCIGGLVLPILENQLSTLHKLAGESMAALLLNSDLQESYRHRGFKDSLKTSSIVSGIPSPGTKPNSLWTERILSSLKQWNVNLLLVRGSVDSSLVDACCFHNILILEHVPYRVLQLLATVSKSNLLIYIPDALQDDVCENIKVSYWSSGYDPHPTVRYRDLKIQHCVRIVCPGNVMTIVLCAPSIPHLIGAEQRLHSCMAKLRGTLHDGKVLPGGGRIEEHLVDKLSQQNGSIADFQHYHRGLVYDALAQGFRSYIQRIHLSMGHHQLLEDAISDAVSYHGSPSSDVHDCFSAKKGAWQRAWHLVKQVLLCDALIITGVDKRDDHLERVL